MKTTFCNLLLVATVLCIAERISAEEETKEPIYVPKTLEESFVELQKSLPIDELKAFTITPENELSNYHLELGMWMRNRWELWSGSALGDYFKSKGITHPDDMSAIIITSFHRHLHGKEIHLDEQIKYYKDYWDNLKFKIKKKN